MRLEEFTIMLDEYVVVDPVDGFVISGRNQSLKLIFFQSE